MIKSHERENDLLRLCLRPRLSDSNLARSHDLLLKDLDWEYLYNFSGRHSLVPFLYHQLKRIGSDLVPPDHLQRFKTSYHSNVARCVFLTNELLSITRDLRSRGIESLPFKGPVLGAIAYGNPALRCFLDLDLIVRPRDVFAAREVLLARGYRSLIDARQEDLLLNSQHNIQFVSEDGGLIVELHWRVSAELFATALSPDDLWTGLETMTLNGFQVNCLALEDLLFALCIHGARHFWEKLSWICDVAALISNQTIDWKRVLASAKDTDTERILLLGLCLAGEIAEEALPQEVRRVIAADQSVNKLAGRVTKRLFSGTKYVPLTPHETFKYSMLMRKSWLARIRYCLFALTPADKDLEMLALPRYLNFAYYGFRPLRVLISSRRGRQTGLDTRSSNAISKLL